jgi:hypothetical protein
LRSIDPVVFGCGIRCAGSTIFHYAITMQTPPYGRAFILSLNTSYKRPVRVTQLGIVIEFVAFWSNQQEGETHVQSIIIRVVIG